MGTHSPSEVVVIGGGVAGLSAAVFTARHGLDTLVVGSDESIPRRNAHLENFPGFPAGVNARQLLDLLEDQAAQAGCEQVTATAASVEEVGDGFAVETEAGDSYRTEYVVATTKNETGHLDGIDGVGIIDRGKAFVDTDERGRTVVDGLYAASRLAEKPHLAAVCAAPGAAVGVPVLEDADQPFYHDWVAPEGTSPIGAVTCRPAVWRSTRQSDAISKTHRST